MAPRIFVRPDELLTVSDHSVVLMQVRSYQTATKIALRTWSKLPFCAFLECGGINGTAGDMTVWARAFSRENGPEISVLLALSRDQTTKGNVRAEAVLRAASLVLQARDSPPPSRALALALKRYYAPVDHWRFRSGGLPGVAARLSP